MTLFKTLRWALLAALTLCAVPAFAQQSVLRNAAVTTTGSASAAPTTALTAGAVEASLIGIEGVSVTVKNAGTYQLEFEGWTGQSWEAYPGIQLSDFSRDTNTTGAGTWFFGNLGFGRIRVRASSYTSGAPNVTIVRGFGQVNAPYSAGSISGGNDAASATGAAVPSSASYTGLNIGGNLVGQTGFTVGASNAGAVAIVDGSGNQITSFGGGTQFAEDVAHSSGATGTMSLGVRTDSVAALAGTTGDYQPFIFNNVGRLWTSATIDAALPAGTNNIGDVDIVSGTITTVSTVTNVATIGTSVTPGTAATNLGKAEDAVHASGDTGVAVLAVRNDAGTTLAGATGDYAPLSVDANGALRVSGSAGTTQYAEDIAHTSGDSMVAVGVIRRDTTPSSSAGTAGDYTALNADANGRLYTQTVLYNSSGSELTLANDVVEDAAETAGVSGPMVLSVRRDTAASSAGTTGDNATFNTDSLGRLWTRPGNPCEDHARVQSAAIDTSTSGNVEVVALNGSDLIVICGLDIVVGSTATAVQLIYGTGTACGTGETNLTGAWPFAANGGISKANAGSPQYVVPAGNAFCVELSAANLVTGSVTYVRTAAP